MIKLKSLLKEGLFTNNTIERKLYGSWSRYKDGKTDSGYVEIKNESEMKEYISKRGFNVKSIKVIQKGENFPHNRSNPYFHDTYSVELKDGIKFKIERAYGRPNWSGNAVYNEFINTKEYSFPNDELKKKYTK
jgi:DNA-dependent RNA polymerase auxiliary subunit epsilon